MTMGFCGTIAAETPGEILGQFEGMCLTNAIWLRNHPEAPALYKSGVRYQREGSPELWFDIAGILAHGYDDCEGLACWRVAELRVAGYRARPVMREYRKPDGALLYHCLVEVDTPDGPMYDDPSARLGMLQQDQAVSGLVLTRKGAVRDSALRAHLIPGPLISGSGGRFSWNDNQKFGGAMLPRIPRLLIKGHDGRLTPAIPEQESCVDFDVGGVTLRVTAPGRGGRETGFLPLLLMAAHGATKALSQPAAQQAAPPTTLPPAPPGFVWTQIPTPQAVSGLDGDTAILNTLRRLLPHAHPGMTWALVPAAQAPVAPAPSYSPPLPALPVAPATPTAPTPPAPMTSASPAQATEVMVPTATLLRRGAVGAIGEIWDPSDRVNLLIDTHGVTYDTSRSQHRPRTSNPEEPR